jgi:methionyl-tRNA synthetase
MNTMNYQASTFTPAYNIFCAPLEKIKDHEGLYPTFCSIPVAGKSLAHAHFEPEVFYIINGTGVMTIGNETQEVTAGDLIKIPPYSRHELKNASQTPLKFLSVYSEDYEVDVVPRSVIVTAAPPTPNGPLHLGHISGPYLAADIIQRQLRLKGSRVLGHSGTDDHQNYVFQRPESIRQEMRLRINSGLRNFNIHFDEFIEPQMDSAYQSKIENFALRAIEAKVAKKEQVGFPFCKDCHHYLVDALIEAQCPDCHASSRGGCESCGLVVPPYELNEPRCSLCQQPASLRSAEVYTFSLSEHLPNLTALKLPPRLKSLVASVADRKNLKVLLTYPDSKGRGLKVPKTEQAIHVWFEMAAHYSQFAKSDATWVHAFGFDNAYYYLLFIPAILQALDPSAKIPEAVITNEFLNLEGQKFSTGRQHAIWADEFKGNTDHLRLFLCLHRPATLEADFSLAAFERFSSQLEQDLSELLLRASALAPGPKETTLQCHRIIREFDQSLSISSFDLRHAARLALNCLDLALQARGSGSSEKIMLETLGRLLSPLMPMTSEKLLKTLEGT